MSDHSKISNFFSKGKRKQPEHPKNPPNTIPIEPPKKIPKRLRAETASLYKGVDPTNKRAVLAACQDFIEVTSTGKVP